MLFYKKPLYYKKKDHLLTEDNDD